MNSEHAAFQLRMEDSRKGKRSRKKGFPTPDPHVDGGNGKKKAIVYNMKKGKKEGTQKKKKKTKEKERERKREKGKN